MKTVFYIILITFCTTATNLHAYEDKPLVYVNKNVGFNIEGYNYQQPALPCDVDKRLIELLVKKANNANINMQVVDSKDKIENGKVPVLLIDIEQLTLGENHNYGGEVNVNFPKVQINAGVLKKQKLQKAKHTCEIALSTPSVMPTDVVKYNNPAVSACSEAEKCLKELSSDVIDWLKPHVK